MRFTRIVLAIALSSIAALSVAQTAQKPAFEVASIKENVSGSRSSGTSSSNGALLRITNYTLNGMVSFAYNIRSFQISGGPDWMDSTRYDVTAKSESQVSDPEKWLEMVQTLLAERFSLRIHRETRDAPIYELIVSKTGPKLQPPATPNSGGMNASQSHIIAKTQSMPQLAVYLSNMLGRPVFDKTALKGGFDFELTWTPDPGPSDTNVAPPSDATGPSIFTALQEQLGLKLESAKGPVEALVIDSAQQPSEN